MSSIFDIARPLVDETAYLTLSTRGRHLARLGLAALWLGLPAAGYFGNRVYLAVQGGGGAPLWQHLLALVAGGAVSLGLVMLAVWLNSRGARARQSFSPLMAESLCQEALDYAAQHPELEAYRRAVVSVRFFTYGDLWAMREFVQGNTTPARGPQPQATALGLPGGQGA